MRLPDLHPAAFLALLLLTIVVGNVAEGLWLT